MTNSSTDIVMARRAPVDFIQPGTLIEHARKAGINITKHRRTIAEVLERAFLVGEYLPALAIVERAQEIDPSVTEGACRRFIQLLDAKGLIVRSVRHSALAQVVAPVLYDMARRRQAEAADTAGASR